MNEQQPMLRRLQPKWQPLSGRQFSWLNVPVALLVLAGLVIGLLWSQLQLTALLLGGLLLATWLWVWFSLHKQTRPRRLELQVATLTAQQEQQQVQFDRLLLCLLQQQQGSAPYCLYRLAASEAFLLTNNASTRQAIEDIWFLATLGLIDHVAGHSLRTLLEALQGQTDEQNGIDVKGYFLPTQQGQHYLSLLQSSLAASLVDC
jgi:signal transduction histidine kinase